MPSYVVHIDLLLYICIENKLRIPRASISIGQTSKISSVKKHIITKYPVFPHPMFVERSKVVSLRLFSIVIRTHLYIFAACCFVVSSLNVFVSTSLDMYSKTLESILTRVSTISSETYWIIPLDSNSLFLMIGHCKREACPTSKIAENRAY